MVAPDLPGTMPQSTHTSAERLPQVDRVVLSMNPTAGSGSPLARSKRLAELLRAAGIQAAIHMDLEEVGRLANAWHEEGRLRALVAVGGDGTAAELVNRTAPGLPIALFPAGNENLLARYLGIGKSPEQLCRIIVDGRRRQFDAARAGDRIFLIMFSCGFDAEVVHRVHARRTGHIRSRNYYKPIAEVLRSYTYPEIQACWDDDAGHSVPAFQASMRWLFAFNFPCYGGGLKIAPNADGRDGLVDVCGFRRGSRWLTLRYAAALLLRRHQRLGDWVAGRTSRLTITATSSVPYQLDGDPGGFLPVEVESLPGRLTLLVPQDCAGV